MCVGSPPSLSLADVSICIYFILLLLLPCYAMLLFLHAKDKNQITSKNFSQISIVLRVEWKACVCVWLNSNYNITFHTKRLIFLATSKFQTRSRLLVLKRREKKTTKKKGRCLKSISFIMPKWERMRVCSRAWEIERGDWKQNITTIWIDWLDYLLVWPFLLWIWTHKKKSGKKLNQFQTNSVIWMWCCGSQTNSNCHGEWIKYHGNWFISTTKKFPIFCLMFFFCLLFSVGFHRNAFNV